MDFAATMAAADRAMLGQFGDEVIYTSGEGQAVTVRGVYSAAHVEATVGEAGVTTVGPAVFLRLAGLPSDPEEDDPTICVAGKSYEVREVQKDGIGGVRLYLREA